MSSDQPPDPPNPQTPKSPSNSDQPSPAPRTSQAQPVPIPPEILAQLIAQAAVQQQSGIVAGQQRVVMQPPIARQMAIQIPLPAIQAQQSWQGPFPPPEAVERYEKTLPGVFNRIVLMAEKMEAAQIEQSAIALENSASEGRRGQYLGAGIGALAIVCAALVGVFGNAWLGAAFLAVPVMGLGKSLVETAFARVNGNATSLQSVAAVPTVTPSPTSPANSGKPDGKPEQNGR